jgi:hypothetical protein
MGYPPITTIFVLAAVKLRAEKVMGEASFSALDFTLCLFANPQTSGNGRKNYVMACAAIVSGKNLYANPSTLEGGV